MFYFFGCHSSSAQRKLRGRIYADDIQTLVGYFTIGNKTGTVYDFQHSQEQDILLTSANTDWSTIRKFDVDETSWHAKLMY